VEQVEEEEEVSGRLLTFDFPIEMAFLGGIPPAVGNYY